MKGIKQVNHFKLYKEISKDNDKTIYLAIDDRINQLVVVKSYTNDSILIKNTNEIGQRMQIAQDAQHEHLIKAYGKEKTAHNTYLSYEYINGGKLSEILYLYTKKNKGEGIKEKQVQIIMTQLIEGFSFMEIKKLIQRDMTLNEVLIHFNSITLKNSLGNYDKIKAFETMKYNIKIDTNSIIINSDKNKTVCNIPNDLLQEEMEKNNTRPRCALWSLGIIAFELLFGIPFNSNNKSNTINHTLISSEALTFIKTLLTIPNHDYITWESVKHLSFISSNSNNFQPQLDLETVMEALLPKSSTIDSAYYSFIDLNINTNNQNEITNEKEISKEQIDNWAVISDKEISGHIESIEIDIETLDIVNDYFN